MLPWSLAVAVAVGLGVAAPVDDDAGTDPTDEAQARSAEAKVELKAGRTAAAAGDYETAVAHFEKARALRPSAGLHYNIGVCHHRRFLGLAEDSPDRESARQAAVDAYNAYLVEASSAEDRYHVAQTVSELGGRPAVIDEWMVRPDEPAPTGPPQLRETDEELEPTDPEPSTPPPAEETGEQTSETPPAPPRATTPPTSRQPPRGPRARIGGALAIGFVGLGKQRETADVETMPSIGLLLRGGAFLTESRELNLGAELGFSTQPSNAARRHRLARLHAALTVDWGRRVAGDRLEIGVGGLAGVAVQSLHFDGTSTAVCPERASGDISSRPGFLLGTRLNVLLMLGPKRNHELGLRVGPGLALFATGSRGDITDDTACSEALNAFSQFGLDGPNLALLSDIGYAGRF